MSDYGIKAKELIGSLGALLDLAKDEIVKEQNHLDILHEEIERYNTLSREAEERWEATRAQCAENIAAAVRDIDLKKKEGIEVQKEIDILVSKKAKLQIDNTRLSEENDKFKTYEEKAWKALHAKEESLIEREEVIQQREGLKPKNKSLLPAVD